MMAMLWSIIHSPTPRYFSRAERTSLDSILSVCKLGLESVSARDFKGLVAANILGKLMRGWLQKRKTTSKERYEVREPCRAFDTREEGREEDGIEAIMC